MLYINFTIRPPPPPTHRPHFLEPRVYILYMRYLCNFACAHRHERKQTSIRLFDGMMMAYTTLNYTLACVVHAPYMVAHNYHK